MYEALKHRIEPLLEEVAAFAADHGGPADLSDLFVDLERYPDIDHDADANYAIGFVVGAAAASGQTSWSLLEAMDLDTDCDALFARWKARR